MHSREMRSGTRPKNKINLISFGIHRALARALALGRLLRILDDNGRKMFDHLAAQLGHRCPTLAMHHTSSQYAYVLPTRRKIFRVTRISPPRESAGSGAQLSSPLSTVELNLIRNVSQDHTSKNTLTQSYSGHYTEL